MKLKSYLKGFTLIEVLISLVILGILSVILFRAYMSLMNISTRIYNEKQLVQSVDFVFFKVDTLLNWGWKPTQDPQGLKFISGEDFWYIKREGERLLLSGKDQIYELTYTWEVIISGFDVTYISWADDKLLGFGLNINAQINKYNPNFWVFDVQGVFQRYFDASFKSLLK